MTDRRKFENDLFEPVVIETIKSGLASTTFVQKRFGVEFGTAARAVDRMCLEGVVSEELPDRSRVVLMSLDDWNRRKD